jgi:hypothetical protein
VELICIIGVADCCAKNALYGGATFRPCGFQVAAWRRRDDPRGVLRSGGDLPRATACRQFIVNPWHNFTWADVAARVAARRIRRYWPIDEQTSSNALDVPVGYFRSKYRAEIEAERAIDGGLGVTIVKCSASPRCCVGANDR